VNAEASDGLAATDRKIDAPVVGAQGLAPLPGLTYEEIKIVEGS